MSKVTLDLTVAQDGAWEEFKARLRDAVLPPEALELARRVSDRLIEYGLSASLLTPQDRVMMEVAVNLDITTLSDIAISGGISAEVLVRQTAHDAVSRALSFGLALLLRGLA